MKIVCRSFRKHLQFDKLFYLLHYKILLNILNDPGKSIFGAWIKISEILHWNIDAISIEIFFVKIFPMNLYPWYLSCSALPEYYLFHQHFLFSEFFFHFFPEHEIILNPEISVPEKYVCYFSDFIYFKMVFRIIIWFCFSLQILYGEKIKENVAI